MQKADRPYILSHSGYANSRMSLHKLSACRGFWGSDSWYSGVNLGERWTSGDHSSSAAWD
nr:hypothetical protein Iba_chr11aCG19080 [Ipomoea batatas]